MCALGNFFYIKVYNIIHYFNEFISYIKFCIVDILHGSKKMINGKL